MERVASTEANKRNLVNKARWVGAATVALYGEGFLLSIAATVALRTRKLAYWTLTLSGGGEGYGLRRMMLDGLRGGHCGGADAGLVCMVFGTGEIFTARKAKTEGATHDMGA